MSIAKNLQTIKDSLGEEVTLVAVSKTKPVSTIMEAYNAGQRHFGENRIQEMVEKEKLLPKDINWHMIGHLQRNKVKYMAPFVYMIHGVDSLKTLKEINRQAGIHKRTIQCLLQIKIAQEESKFGLSSDELSTLLNDDGLIGFENIVITGFMGMASFTSDLNQVRSEFVTLKTIFDKYNKSSKKNIQLSHLSMGMSGDYKIAVEEGSNMVRVGSAIFGLRN